MSNPFAPHMYADDTYTLRVFPEDSSFFSFTPEGAVGVDFSTALTEARKRPDCDTWWIVNDEYGVIVRQRDANPLWATLWRNSRRNELAAARRAEVERRLESRIIGEMILLERDVRRARREVVDSSPVHPTGRLWRAMQRNALYNAIDEAVRS